MGSPVSQVAQSTQPQSKGFQSIAPAPQTVPNPADVAVPDGTSGQISQQPQLQGKGGRTTYSGQSGQPQFGQPNNYPNTVGQWDNASIQPQQSRSSGGKGKG